MRFLTGKKIKNIARNIWHNPMIQKFVPAKIYIKIQYKNHIGKMLNLSKPKSYNEKLQWLKLYDHKHEYTQLVDKYEVRKYISETIGENYLIPLVGVYNSYNEIDFYSLPNEFVLKLLILLEKYLFVKINQKLTILIMKNRYLHG